MQVKLLLTSHKYTRLSSFHDINTIQKKTQKKNNYPCFMRNSVLQIQNMFCFLILNYYCVILTLQCFLHNLFIFNTKWNSYSIHNSFWLHVCRKVIWIKIYIVKNNTFVLLFMYLLFKKKDTRRNMMCSNCSSFVVAFNQNILNRNCNILNTNVFLHFKQHETIILPFLCLDII